MRFSGWPCLRYDPSMFLIQHPSMLSILCIFQTCVPHGQPFYVSIIQKTVKICLKICLHNKAMCRAVEKEGYKSQFSRKKILLHHFLVSTRQGMQFYVLQNKSGRGGQVERSGCGLIGVSLFEILLELAFLNTRLKSTHQFLLVFSASCFCSITLSWMNHHLLGCT